MVRSCKRKKNSVLLHTKYRMIGPLFSPFLFVIFLVDPHEFYLMLRALQSGKKREKYKKKKRKSRQSRDDLTSWGGIMQLTKT